MLIWLYVIIYVIYFPSIVQLYIDFLLILNNCEVRKLLIL